MTTESHSEIGSRFDASLSTGIEILDEYLDGGLLSGSVVALFTDPVSQADLLLARLTHERETLYLTLHRSQEAVTRSLEYSGANMANTTVCEIGANRPLGNAYELLKRTPQDWNVVIDPMNALESMEADRLASFLNATQSHLASTHGLLYLHVLTGDTAPPRRWYTAYHADVVFELDTEFYGDRVDTRLFVRKNRGGSALPDAIKLELLDHVEVDTSREIA